MEPLTARTVSEGVNFAFSIPHIQESIFRHGGLSSRDLAKASRVSRAWSKVVSRFLWETIELEGDRSQTCYEAFRNGLVSHGQSIRNLITDKDDVLCWVSEALSCTRLTRIKMNLMSNLDIHDHNAMKRLTSRNLNLQVFRWHRTYCYSILSFSDIAQELTNPIRPRCLETLDLMSFLVDASFAKVLNYHAGTMKSLALEECVTNSKAFKDLEPLLNLTTLVMNMGEYSEDDEVSYVDSFWRLINAAPNLREFALGTYYPRIIQELPKFLKCSSLLHLETLNVIYGGLASSQNSRASEFLDVVPRSLTRLTLNGFSLSTVENTALSNLFQTSRLTYLKIVDCPTITSATWQTILVNGRFLIEIVNDGYSPLDVVAMNEPWGCVDIERLRMVFDVGHRTLENTGEVLDAHEFKDLDVVVLEDCKKIFVQLGALTRLKELRMSIKSPRQRLSPVPKQGDGQFERLNVKDFETTVEELLQLWSHLSACVDMEVVYATLTLPARIANIGALETKSREMWGDQAEVTVRLGI